MPKKRSIPILFLFLCTCGIDRDTDEPAAEDGTYESLTVAERAVVDHERATAHEWEPVHDAYAQAVRGLREAGQ